jgi:hypothetical protein
MRMAGTALFASGAATAVRAASGVAMVSGRMLYSAARSARCTGGDGAARRPYHHCALRPFYAP